MSKGRSKRVKGNAFERKIANQLKPILGQAKRGIQFRNESDKVQDVECPLFGIECKSYKRNAPIRRAYNQALKVCVSGKIPLAVTKEDYKVILATLAYADFRALTAVFIDTYKTLHPESDWEKAIIDLIEAKKLQHKAEDKAAEEKKPINQPEV